MIYLFCYEPVYKFIEDYLISLLIHLTDWQLVKYDIGGLNDFEFLDHNIHVFIQNVPVERDLPNTYVLNTEQTTLIGSSNHIGHELIKKIRDSKYGVLDYSSANLKFFPNGIGVLPYQVNRNEIYDLPKTKSVAYISPRSSIYRRRQARQLLKAGINFTTITGWKEERDRDLFQHKILVNVHVNRDYRIFEEIRCNRCVFNKMIVITEKSDHFNEHPLKQYMIECESEKLAECVEHTLANYASVYEQLFGQFDLDKIEADCLAQLNRTISEIIC